jgi:hypothetical protein
MAPPCLTIDMVHITSACLLLARTSHVALPTYKKAGKCYLSMQPGNEKEQDISKKSLPYPCLKPCLESVHLVSASPLGMAI